MQKTTSKIKKVRIKHTAKKRPSIFTNKGFSGFFVIVAVIFAVFLAGAFSSMNTNNPVQGIIDPNNKFQNPTDKKTLQLRTLGFISVTPTSPPITSTPQNVNCQDAANTESQILVGSDPAPGGTAVAGGKLRMWINDEGAPKIAPGEQVDTTTGQIITPGNRTANDGGIDNHAPGGHRTAYIWEPAIYLTTISTPTQIGPYTGDAENGGKPYFPTLIKGDFNNNPTNDNTVVKGAPLDPDYINFENGPDYLNRNVGTHLPELFTAEYVWDINSLNLQPGLYHVEEVVHDGDSNLAVNCIEFQL